MLLRVASMVTLFVGMTMAVIHGPTWLAISVSVFVTLLLWSIAFMRSGDLKLYREIKDGAVDATS